LPDDVELATPWAYWENEPCINGAFMVIKPSKKLFEERIKPWLNDQKIKNTFQREIFDMDIINMEWEHRGFLTNQASCRVMPEVLMLPSHYLVLDADFVEPEYSQKLNKTHHKNGKKGLFEMARVIHSKPWMAGAIAYIPGLPQLWLESKQKICKEWDICDQEK
jgi:hypothetical protein